ncbi:MAG: universal stress protein [Bacteroidota bacterium]|jgi:nucleotide-binding universal stress UspA family protein|nr:universal stress protein [Bacteroidota bacterium]MCA6444421.1 universal stress protein [Bacteroidota bacterium]
MKKFNVKNILVPYDFSKTAEIALNKAAFIAQQTKANLILTHISKVSDLVDLFLLEIKASKGKALNEFIEKKLSEVADSITAKYKCKVVTYHQQGSIASEIIDAADFHHADLIVMGTKGKDSNSDLFLGSNAYRVITKSDVPVMTITADNKVNGFNSILLPIDLSDHTRQKVNYAVELAKVFNSKITALAIYTSNEKELKYKLEVILSQIAKKCASSKVEVETRIEKTAHRISKTLSVAKRVKADLIISMTDEKMEGSKKWLSTYDHELVNNSKIPVISMQPEVNNEFTTEGTMLPY